MKFKEDWERIIMMNMAKRGRVFTIVGYVIMSITIGGVTLGSLFGIPMHSVYNITNPGDRYFPFESYYPYDFWESPYFELSYLGQVIGILFASISFTSIANFFIVLVFHICGQLEIIVCENRKLEITVD